MKRTCIFGPHKEWSSTYVMQNKLKVDNGDYKKGSKKRLYNSETTARHQYRWDDSSVPCIIPISRMNRFPFWIKNTEYPVDVRVIDYKNPGNSVTSTPMPSINTTIRESKTFTVSIPYKLFNQENAMFEFIITYEKRDSHHLYDGIVGNTHGNAAFANVEGLREVQGITDWNLLKNPNDDFLTWEER